jgi:alpha-beta hydrolase superfamily lysophospholipase
MRRSVIAGVGFLAVAVALVGGAGEVLRHPALRSIGTPPPDLSAKSITLRTARNQPVAGWMVGGKPGVGVVVLLHGVRGDRREMIGRARFLNQLGYSVLLIDLPAHGESAAEHITYGLNESEGVKTALAYLSREFPDEKIGVIGVSLGAASLVLSEPSPAPNAVVLESMFPTITEAVLDRLRRRVGPLAEPLAPLLLWQLPLRLGIYPEQLRPIARLSSLRSPVLIASGSIDQHTTLDETKRLYDAARRPKELWVVEGAAHVDLHAFDPAAYESKISAFLARYLRQQANPSIERISSG